MGLSPAPVRSRMRGARTGTGPRPVRIARSGRCPWRTSRWRPSSVCLSAWPLRKAVTSASTACANRARAPPRRTSVSGAENSAGWISLTTLSWVTACHSFGGEVEARTPPRYAASTPHAVTNFRAYLVVDATGRIVREAKVASEPEALITFLRGLNLPLVRIGLEAGPLSQWLQAALVKAGFEAVLLETRHVKAALSAMIVKTDRKDARGIAQLLRMGWFRPVHCKSAPAQEVRALLVARKQLQAKMRDVELSLRGLLRGFGLKVGEISKGQFAARVRTLVAGHTMLKQIAEAMLQAREALQMEFGKLHRAMLAIVRADEVCRRLMTVPGVGALVAVTFTSGVDAPERFARSKGVGAPRA